MPVPALAADDLAFAEAAMLDGSGPVLMARLPDAGDGAFRGFVRFPAGWNRPVAGHYTFAEDILVLEGGLRLDGRTWRAGAFVRVPAFALRGDTAAPDGCLAFARFAGPPRWRRGTAEAAAAPVAGLDDWRAAAPADGPFGAGARQVAADEPACWALDRGWSGAAPYHLEWLAWPSRTWHRAAAGEAVAIAAPAFVRAVPAGSH